MRVLRCLGLVSVLLMAASRASALDVALQCDAAAARTEQLTGIPAGVLAAVGMIESGRASDLGRSAWPWTVNALGRGASYATKRDAIAAVYALMARGAVAIDLGCFQVDILHHAGVFRSLDDAFDPMRNAREAARILLDQRARGSDWPDAVARYHSADPARGLPYLQRVRAALPAARSRSGNAGLLAAIESDANRSKLPRVVYGLPPQAVAAAPQTRFRLADRYSQ